MRLAWAFIRRDFLLKISYRGALVIELVGIAFFVPVLFYVTQVFGGAESASLKPYGGVYFPFLLLGIAFQDYTTISLSSFNTSIREHQMMGTLEIVMLSPTPVSVILLYSSLWGYVFTSLRFMVYLLTGLFFGLDLSHANILSFLLSMSLAILSFAALGILTASLTLTIKRGEIATTILTGATVVLSDVLYQISVLQAPLQTVAQFFPFTHALAGIRKAILLGASPMELLPELTALMLFALILFPLGLWTFTVATQRAKVSGTLGQY